MAEIKYSFVIPIYCDASLAASFCEEIDNTMRDFINQSNYRDSFEVLFVCDGGKHDDFDIVSTLTKTYCFVKAIELSRNFGQHIAISCGYENSKGSIVGMLNVDQQDPPSQIPLLIKQLEENDLDIVYGIAEKRHTDFVSNTTSKIFCVFLNKLTGFDFPLNTTTLRLMKRPFIDVLNSLNERYRYLPGLEGWIGFRRGFVNIQTQPRTSGKTSYTFGKRAKLAIEAVLSFSDLPLRSAVVIGAIIAAGGLCLGTFFVIQKLFLQDILPGYTSIAALVAFLGGTQIAFAGLMSLYIGRTLTEVQHRPLYIIRRETSSLRSN